MSIPNLPVLSFEFSYGAVWDVLWPIAAVLLTGATSYYFYRKSKRHAEWREYAQRVHDTLVPLAEIIGVFYAHGLEYPNSDALKAAIDEASSEKLNARKLGRRRYQRWNTAVMRSRQAYLAYRMDVSGESVSDVEVAYLSPEELKKNPERFWALAMSAQTAIEVSLKDMRTILGFT